MIDQLKTQLAQLSQKLRRLDKVNTMLDSLRMEEAGLVGQEQRLRVSLNKENANVQRLEKTTATSVLYSMLGKKEEKLQQEQQEAAAARLKYDAVVRQLDDCRHRLETLLTELKDLAPCQAEYDEVFRQIQNQLRSNPKYAHALCQIESSIGQANSQLAEIEEALSVGRAAMEQIDVVEAALNSAKNLGTWDLIGGGLLVDLAKHSRLDEAQSSAEYLQVLLSRFRTELADVHISPHLGQVNIDGFLRFADYFFDGLLADWSVLSRIKESLQSLYVLHRQLSGALGILENMRQSMAGEKDYLEKQLESLVTNARP